MRLNFEIICAFEVRPQLTNILVTRNNILHRIRIYLQKMKVLFSSTMLSYSVTAPISLNIPVHDVYCIMNTEQISKNIFTYIKTHYGENYD